MRLSLVALLLLGGAGPVRAQPEPSVDCNKCHADRDILRTQSGSAARADTLLHPDTVLVGTVHEADGCIGCHPWYDSGYPHRAPAVATECAACHADQGTAWAGSAHAANTTGDAATCIDCHGRHVIHAADDRGSPTHPLNVAAMCGTCHGDSEIIDAYFAAPADTVGRTAVSRYLETVHGMALTRSGLTVAATCNDCHGAHAILPADSSASTVNRAHIPETCGGCHEGVTETYRHSAHGETYLSGRPGANGEEAPVCVDCHSAHGIVRADEPEWFIDVVEECGQCHEDLYETYFETYHGKVTRLGFGLTAKCSDCHTAHAMLPATDTASTVFPTNLVATCAQCHPDANANFVRYYAHGDPTDRVGYPILFWVYKAMTLLLISVFTFFGLHTALWLTRLAIDRLRRPGPAAPPVSGAP